jgi:dihydrofolate synthase/folylpolyglutamate synthase
VEYAAAVGELQRRGRFGISLGLTRIQRLLDELDHPERGLRGALVAGTNGKGSVVAMTSAVLHAAGLHTGTMPKPHLTSYRERIALDGKPVDEARFAAAVARVVPAADAVAAALGEPTEFELLTAAAVTELARSPIDLAIIEVGMGGRLDATNALDLGVAAITNVQRDHERHLGHTIRAIAAEKAAIIKRGNAAVTGARWPAIGVIAARCREVGGTLRRAGAGGAYRATLRHAGWAGLTIDLERPGGPMDDVRIGLLGGHQAANAAVAVALLDALAERHGLHLPEEAVRGGLMQARWPGRLELIEAPRLPGARKVLLDGAHNPDGVRALATALRELALQRPRILFGAMRGKRLAAMLRSLQPLEPRIVFTRADPSGGVPARILAATWRRVTGLRAQGDDDPDAALEMAADQPGSDPLVVCGSLYLVGRVRGALLGVAEAAA